MGHRFVMSVRRCDYTTGVLGSNTRTLTKESVFPDTEQGINSAFPPSTCPEGSLSSDRKGCEALTELWN